MAILSLRKILLLALLATTNAYMDALDDGEDENEDGELDPDDDTPRGPGQRCGTTNQCVPGFDCVRAPVRRRCYPVECTIAAFKQTVAQTGFDLHKYGQDVMDDAGVTMESSMFRAFPDTGLNLFNRDSEDLMKMNQAIINRQPPLNMFKASFSNCTGQSDDKQADGVTAYGGASWELGALGTYNGDIFYGQGSGDTAGLGILNNCFGFVLGLDAGISGLLGLAFTDMIADLTAGCKQMFPVASFPPVELQLGFIASEIPTFLMEITAGASASTGLPGFTSCTTTAL